MNPLLTATTLCTLLASPVTGGQVAEMYANLTMTGIGNCSVEKANIMVLKSHTSDQVSAHLVPEYIFKNQKVGNNFYCSHEWCIGYPDIKGNRVFWNVMGGF